jgi:hypothetical protein
MSKFITYALALTLGFLIAVLFISNKNKNFLKDVQEQQLTRTKVVYRDTVITRTVFKPTTVTVRDIVTKYKTKFDTIRDYQFFTDTLYLDNKDSVTQYRQFTASFPSPTNPGDTNFLKVYNVIQSKYPIDTSFITIQWLKNITPNTVVIRDTVNTITKVNTYKSGFTLGASLNYTNPLSSNSFSITPQIGIFTKSGKLFTVGNMFNTSAIQLRPTISYHQIMFKKK